MINQNTLAKEVANLENGKQNLSIAQIKEVVKCTLQVLGAYKPSEVLALLEKHAE